MIQVSDLEDELDRSSGVRSSGFIVAHITSNLEEKEEEEEEEEMPLVRKKRSGLRELLRMPRALSFLLLLLLLQLTPLHLPI